MEGVRDGAAWLLTASCRYRTLPARLDACLPALLPVHLVRDVFSVVAGKNCPIQPSPPPLSPTTHNPRSSLAFQPPEELALTLDVARQAGVTVVSLPLVNQWTQDRSHEGGRTPRWRGITLLHELRQVGIRVA